MLARSVLRIVKSSVNVVVPKTPVFATAVRSFAAKPHVPSGDVVIPELADTLEWVLDSPPTVHQFDEPPIVVEIEHLENLVVAEDH